MSSAVQERAGSGVRSFDQLFVGGRWVAPATDELIEVVSPITEEVVDFQMPGSVIPGFSRTAVQMAKAGIYDLRIHHDDIVTPLLRQWRVWELEGLDEDGERARDELAAAVSALDGEAARFVERRAEAAAKKAARQG